MLKLFLSNARNLLVLLTGIRGFLAADESGGVLNQTLMTYVHNFTRDNPDHPLAQRLRGIDWQDALAGVDYDGTLEALLAQVDEAEHKSGDVPLINEIIEILGLPYATNRFGQDAITALRRALFTPSELEQFKRKAKEAFVCSTCSHVFQSGEAVVIRREADQDIRVCCLQCQDARYGTCSSCGESAPLTNTGVLMLRSSKMVSCDCKTRKATRSLLEERGVQFHTDNPLPIGPQPAPPSTTAGRRAAARALQAGRERLTFTEMRDVERQLIADTNAVFNRDVGGIISATRLAPPVAAPTVTATIRITGTATAAPTNPDRPRGTE